MRKPFLIGMLAGIALLCAAATFGPVVFRSWVLQHDLDGGGHTISNVAIDATSLLLDGAAVGGDTVWTNESSAGQNTFYPPNTYSSYSKPFYLLVDEFLSQSSLTAIGSDNNSVYIDMVARFSQGTNARAYIDAEDDNNLFFRLDPNGIYSDNARYVFNAANATASRLLDIQNGGTNKFTVSAVGLASAAGGFQKGAFTGITTTNTFYSVSSGLLTTVTNVVVVQGGIITSWTVTP